MCIDAQYFEDRMDDLFDSDMLSCVSDVKVKEMAEVGKKLQGKNFKHVSYDGTKK